MGKRSDALNGVYEATGDLYNGKPLYRKRDDNDKWLLFTTTNNWCFSPSASKNSKDGKGWCFSVQTGIDHPTQVAKWKIYANGAEDKWEDHALMKCIVHQDVMVSGVVGRKADQLNGVYEATGDLCNGKPLFRKRNNPGALCEWLRFDTSINLWVFGTTANKDVNDSKGVCASVKSGIDHPTQVDKWKIYANLAVDQWEEHAPMKCMVCTSSLSRKRNDPPVSAKYKELPREQQQQQQQQQPAWQQQQQHEWRTRTNGHCGGSQQRPQWQEEPRRSCSIQ